MITMFDCMFFTHRIAIITLLRTYNMLQFELQYTTRKCHIYIYICT